MTARQRGLAALALAAAMAVAGCGSSSSGGAAKPTPSPTFPASGVGHAKAVAACTDLAESGTPTGGHDKQRTRGYQEAVKAAAMNSAYARLASDWQAEREAAASVKAAQHQGTADATTLTSGLTGAVAAAETVRRDCGALGVPIPDHSF